jgi:hypothetical protein
MWLLAHIYFLIDFRNRLVVMIDWAWAYWTFQRSARIVFGPAPPPPGPEKARAINGLRDEVIAEQFVPKDI